MKCPANVSAVLNSVPKNPASLQKVGMSSSDSLAAAGVSEGAIAVGSPGRPLSICDQLAELRPRQGVLEGTADALPGTEQLEKLQNQVSEFGPGHIYSFRHFKASLFNATKTML